MHNTFNDEGGYKVDDGYMDEAADTGGATLRLDPSKIRGMESFRAGDEVMLHIKARVGETGEDGMADFQVVRVKFDDMDAGARKMRAEEPKVDMTGTGLE